MMLSKVIVRLDNGEERECDCSSLPDWVNWIAVRRWGGGVFAFEYCDDEGGAGMCLPRELA